MICRSDNMATSAPKNENVYTSLYDCISGVHPELWILIPKDIMFYKNLMHAWLQLCILQKRKRKSLLPQARCMPNNAFVYKNYNFNGIFQILLLEIVI
jgi:hypothetical protein